MSKREHVDTLSSYRSLLDPPHGEGPHQAMMAIGMAHEIMAAFQWEEFLDASRRWDSVGWLQDPTAFRDSLRSEGWSDIKALAEAAKRFVDDVGEIKGRAQGRGEE